MGSLMKTWSSGDDDDEIVILGALICFLVSIFFLASVVFFLLLCVVFLADVLLLCLRVMYWHNDFFPLTKNWFVYPPFLVLSNPQRFNWRWKLLNLVCWKFFFNKQLTKASWLRILNSKLPEGKNYLNYLLKNLINLL